MQSDGAVNLTVYDHSGLIVPSGSKIDSDTENI